MKSFTVSGTDERGKKVKHDVFAHSIADAVEIAKSIGVRSFNHVIQISKSMEADRCRQSKR